MEEDQEPSGREGYLDDTDRRILNALLKTGDVNLREIAEDVGVSKSTVHNRLRRMKDIDFLQGFYPLVNQDMLEGQVTAISLIRAKYGPSYAETLGKELANVKGVWALYYVIGENDIVALIRAKSRTELTSIVDRLSSMSSIERSNTILVMSVFKEDPREAIRTD